MKYRGTQMFEDIKNSSDWQSVDKVSKGWSSDSKYFIKTKDQYSESFCTGAWLSRQRGCR